MTLVAGYFVLYQWMGCAAMALSWTTELLDDMFTSSAFLSLIVMLGIEIVHDIILAIVNRPTKQLFKSWIADVIPDEGEKTK